MTGSSYPERQAEQRREAAPRRQEQEDEIRAGQTGADRDDGVTLEDDNIDRDGHPQPRPEANENEDRPQAPIVRKSPSDAIRDKIASNFRRQDEQPFSGDINDPELIYGESAREVLEPDPNAPEPGVPEHATAAPPAQPRKIKLKVNGQDVELTEDEVIARAQKVSAADSYLDEAKTLLKEAKQIKRSRSGADVDQDQDDENDRNEDPNDNQPQPRQNPGQKLAEVVRKIQYDDPAEAAQALGEAIEEVADTKADERQLKRLLSNDLTRSQKALKDFKEANPDLVNDPRVGAVIEASIYGMYREDIIKLGVVAEDQIPKDPRQLADWHRFYRVHGHEVRTTETLLKDAKASLEEFRGGNRQPGNPRPAPARAQPRVDVNVNRTERRTQIPVQPSRAAVPAASQTQGNPKPQDRSSVISEMRRQRGQPVG